MNTKRGGGSRNSFLENFWKKKNEKFWLAAQRFLVISAPRVCPPSGLHRGRKDDYFNKWPRATRAHTVYERNLDDSGYNTPGARTKGERLEHNLGFMYILRLVTPSLSFRFLFPPLSLSSPAHERVNIREKVNEHSLLIYTWPSCCYLQVNWQESCRVKAKKKKAFRANTYTFFFRDKNWRFRTRRSPKSWPCD